MSRHSQTYVTDGLVLRTSQYGENDTLVEILTADRGRVALLARGTRSPKNANRAAVQPFTYSNLEIAKKDGPGWIRSTSVTESFFAVREDMVKLALASYFCEVGYELSGEEEPAETLLQLLLNTLYLLAWRVPNGEKETFFRVKAAFELRVMAISGYVPELSRCARCGTEHPAFGCLDVVNGTLVCERCAKSALASYPTQSAEPSPAESLLPVRPSVLSAMRYVIDAPPKRVYAFTLPETGAAEEFSRVMERYLEHHLEQAFVAVQRFHEWRVL